MPALGRKSSALSFALMTALLAIGPASPEAGAQHRPAGESPGRGGSPPPPPPPRPSIPPTRPGASGAAPRAPQPGTAARAPARDFALERARERRLERAGDCTGPGVSPAPDRFDVESWWAYNSPRLLLRGHRAARPDLARVAATVLSHALTDTDPRVVEAGLVALGAVGDGEDVAKIAAAATGPDEALRFAAAIALAASDAGAARDALLSRLDDPSEIPFVRAGAALALGARRDEALASRLSDLGSKKGEDEEVRIASLVAASHSGGPKLSAVIARVLADLSESHAVRSAAAVALGKTSDPSALDALLVALADKVSDVRGAAAAGMGALMRSARDRLGDKLATASRALAEKLEDEDESRPVRALAALALAEARDEWAVRALSKALSRADGDVRAAAALAAGIAGDAALVRQLKRLLVAGRREPDAVGAAALGAGVARAAALSSSLTILLRSETRPLPRAAAALGLALVGAPSAAATIDGLLAPGGGRLDPVVESALVEAMGILPESGGRAALLRVVEAEGADPFLVADAVRALGVAGDEADLPRLATLARDASARGLVRAAAVRAIARIAGECGPSHLALLLEDTGAITSTAAIEGALYLR